MPRTTNPTNKDLDESIQAATQQFEENNNRLTEGLGEVNTAIIATNTRLTEELGVLNSKFETQQQIFQRDLAANNESLKLFIAETIKAYAVPATTFTTTAAATTAVTASDSTTTDTAIMVTATAANTSTTTVFTTSGTPHSPSVPPGYELILPTPSTPIQTPIFTTTTPLTLPISHTPQSFPSTAIQTPIHTTTIPLTLPINHTFPIFPTTPITIPLQPPYQIGTYTPSVMNTSMYSTQPLQPPPFPPPPQQTAGTTTPLFFPHHTPYYIPQLQQFPSYPNFLQNSPTPQTHNSPHPNFRNPKIEMGTFDGTNALDWLFQAEQFFLFYNVALENRLPMVAFYTTRKILNTDGRNLSLKCKNSVTKHVRDRIGDGFNSVVNFLVSKLLETDFIFRL
ncbi:unnamed protein product [Trifolium pratense]|uniref:Uncharacterized protein n=1 Tax=Trifolium pratense TaxID=57577 RepID=A0ACB0JXC7_TRIPR|nr:unnamed protein product [Trifolium pratense]